jgi:membrane-bound metal-dependent hydrolase YbcI (DUF457 family)
MPGFRTHVTTSAALGVGSAIAGYSYGLPLTTCAVGAGLCTIGGMLPDLDGDTGVPVRETIHLVAAVVPALMLGSLQAAGWDRESMVLGMAGMYVLIRFVLGEWFKRVTVHRGMWHSIPAALNIGLITLLICSGEDIVPRAFKAAAIMIGFFSHLVLDEIVSLNVFQMRAKESLGTALKLWMPQHWWPNVLTYGMLVALSVAACQHPVIRNGYAAWRLEAQQKALATPASVTPAGADNPVPPSTLVPVTGQNVQSTLQDH